jgi:uncharacterized membrane protein
LQPKSLLSHSAAVGARKEDVGVRGGGGQDAIPCGFMRCSDAMTASSVNEHRISLLDQLRGGAVLAMIFYHFAFDIKFLLGLDVFHSFPSAWTIGTRVITAVFMLCVGASVYLGTGDKSRFWARQAKIAAGATLVSLVTYFFAQGSWIYFGVLHCIFLMSFLLLPVRKYPVPGGFLGAGIIIAWGFGWIPEFPTRFTKSTLDYAPLIPWIGIGLLGIPFGYWMKKIGNIIACAAIGNFLALVGRHSLMVYLLHQPVLIAVLLLVKFSLSLEG